ncbi:MAG: DoxX family membrane protein [Acidobacteria bacterium]|nr:DoxX family membrane protein [Acidobacteriota bacterium]
MPSDFDATSSIRAKRALALVRILIGAMFVWVFFENYAKGLYTPAGYANLIDVYATRGQAPEAWKSVMRLMAANAAVAAPLQAMAEISFGVLLVLGLLTPPVAMAAFGFLTSLWVSEWGSAWIWELLVPMGAALAISVGAAGRTWGIDRILARRNPHALWW